MIRTVYLAGPITGLSYDAARLGWRTEFAEMLQRLGADHIQCRSPMRAKQFLSDQKRIDGDPNAYAANPLSVAKGITTRDRNDVMTSDAVVANFLGAERCSAGTCVEFGWADAYRKPVIMVIEPQGLIAPQEQGQSGANKNPHWHAIMNEIAGYIVPTLEEAAYICQHLLTAGL